MPVRRAAEVVHRATTLAETRRIYLPPWRVDLTVRAGVRSPVAGAVFARAVALSLAAAGAPRPASLGLILTDDRELAGLNQEHMGTAGPTDVLSFPLLPLEAFPSHEGRPTAPGADARPSSGASASTQGGARGASTAGGFALPPGVRLHLGDIVVSVERAIAQADAGRGGWTGDRRWSPADELRLLVVHGTLHVCGWDHAERVEEAAMRQLEAALLTGHRVVGR